MKSEELLFNEAKKLHINGKIKDAQVIYLKLLETNSKNSNLLYLLGTTYVQLKNFHKGKEYLNLSINNYKKLGDDQKVVQLNKQLSLLKSE